MKKKIITIIGARPQFIKHAPLSKELEKIFDTVTIHTGQHFDKEMSDFFFNDLSIKTPEYIFKGLESISLHGAQVSFMIEKIEQILIEEKPDAVLVYGDTNSTLAGALAASKLSVPIIHIEAGLRSFNLKMPEEINRIITDRISHGFFCPTKTAKINLKKEGFNKNIFLIGDVMKDSVSMLRPRLVKKLDSKYIFTTLHRPYNTDDKLRLITILSQLNKAPHIVIFSLHPRTLKMLSIFDIKKENFSNIKFIEPVNYLDSLSYQSFSECVVTDSGGIQKEAYILKKKCITIRSETEWVETLEGNWNILNFDNLDNFENDLSIMPDQDQYNNYAYGKGNISKKIAKTISKII
jgi:UDP-GlcNAc3NAcA epimerase